MKFGTLLFLLTFSAFANAGEIDIILSSPGPQCVKAKTIYKTLTNKRIEDHSNYVVSVFDIYGTNPEGREVIINLSGSYSCNWGSFGGGGCQNYYNCSVEIH